MESLDMLKKARCILLAAVAGSLLGIGSCLDVNWQHVVRDTALYVGQGLPLDGGPTGPPAG